MKNRIVDLFVVVLLVGSSVITNFHLSETTGKVNNHQIILDSLTAPKPNIYEEMLADPKYKNKLLYLMNDFSSHKHTK